MDVAGLDDRGHVEGVLQRLQGLVPDADRMAHGVFPVGVLGDDGAEDFSLMNRVALGHKVG